MSWGEHASCFANGTWLIGCLFLAVSWSQVLMGAEFTNDFEQQGPHWRLQAASRDVRLLIHRTDPQAAHAGSLGERFQFENSGTDEGLIRLEHDCPRARPLDEFEACLMVRGTVPGLTIAVRLVCPEILDPATGEPLTTVITGETYEAIGKWQKLKVRTTDAAIQQRLVLLRARARRPIEAKQLLIDRVMLAVRIQPGRIDFDTDDLLASPLVTADGELSRDIAAGGPASLRAEFRLDGLVVDGKPFFPRMIRYHGEAVESLVAAGVNCVWLPDGYDVSLVEKLGAAGIWAVATPGRPTNETGEIVSSREIGLMPFGMETSGILFWMLGTRVGREHRGQVGDWVTQLQEADRRLRRPIAIDVQEDERWFSRQVDMLGVSRHVLQTSISLRQYRDWLIQRRSIARPGTFCWTWLQSEVPAIAAGETSPENQPCIEVEQLRLQAYAALASGFRGIGFWTTGPIDGDGALARERFWAISQINRELTLLEPWLATCTATTLTGLKVESQAPPVINHRSLPFGVDEATRNERDALLRERNARRQAAERRDNEVSVAVLRTDYGLLLLPMWLEDYSQFVPAQLAAANVSIVVPGANESASAFEVTTTGVRTLVRERVTGGIRVTLPKFDQTAAILVTSDRDLVAQLQQRASVFFASSAEANVELASLKFARVEAIDEQLGKLGVAQQDGPQLLASARNYRDRARQQLVSGDFRAGYESAMNSMQFLRILQRAHWDQAVARLSQPSASTGAISFQTLPAHWQLMMGIGQGEVEETVNLLPGGDFEDFQTLLAQGWTHEQPSSNGGTVQVSMSQPQVEQQHAVTAELVTGGRGGAYALRLAAATPSTEQAVIQSTPVVTVGSPPIAIRPGTILHCSGFVQVTAAPKNSLDGVLVYDNIGGRDCGLRFQPRPGWQSFEFLRVATTETALELTLSLSGQGEALFDDLRVVAINPGVVAASGTATGPRSSPKKGNQKRNPFDRMPRSVPK